MTEIVTQVLQRIDAARMSVGTVQALDAEAVVVTLDGDGRACVRCAILVTHDAAPARLAPGDRVLTWIPPDATNAVVLGRVGPTIAPTPRPVGGMPDTLVIEARESLTLRVGDGSITIREDGKILIKGKDLVSHAQRTNRIKGGSVAIN